MAKNATGKETSISAEMGGEYFTCSGLIIDKLNYLEVYTYDKWSDKYCPKFSPNQVFTPSFLGV